MTIGVDIGIEGVGTTVLKYFNPARSPFYPIVAFGGVALVMSCGGIANTYWYFVAIPIYLCIAIGIGFSLAAQPGLKSSREVSASRPRWSP